jgi:hypothetical protein
MKFFPLEQIPYVPIVFGFVLIFTAANWRLRRRR